MSRFLDVSGTVDKKQKRKVRRKGMRPEGILLGHKVKNFMTVI